MPCCIGLNRNGCTYYKCADKYIQVRPPSFGFSQNSQSLRTAGQVEREPADLPFGAGAGACACVQGSVPACAGIGRARSHGDLRAGPDRKKASSQIGIIKGNPFLHINLPTKGRSVQYRLAGGFKYGLAWNEKSAIWDVYKLE
jgi:hypothetical protein